MNKCEVTLTANAGVLIKSGGIRIMVDALHQNKVLSFSTLADEMLATIRNSPEFLPDIVIATHNHPDHYSKELVSELLQRHPETIFIAPFCDFAGQICLKEKLHEFSLQGSIFKFKKVPHDGGDRYPDTINYACFIEFPELSVLIPGDAEINAGNLTDLIGAKQVDLALLNFPWITLPHGRDDILNIIKPKNIMIYHLPFASDDDYGFRPAAESAAKKISNNLSVKILKDPLQSEYLD